MLRTVLPSLWPVSRDFWRGLRGSAPALGCLLFLSFLPGWFLLVSLPLPLLLCLPGPCLPPVPPAVADPPDVPDVPGVPFLPEEPSFPDAPCLPAPPPLPALPGPLLPVPLASLPLPAPLPPVLALLGVFGLFGPWSLACLSFGCLPVPPKCWGCRLFPPPPVPPLPVPRPPFEPPPPVEPWCPAPPAGPRPPPDPPRPPPPDDPEDPPPFTGPLPRMSEPDFPRESLDPSPAPLEFRTGIPPEFMTVVVRFSLT